MSVNSAAREKPLGNQPECPMPLGQGRYDSSKLVARGRIELPTYRFSGGRSYQLSYLAVPLAEDPAGLEQSTRAVPDRGNRAPAR
jgi:hypothetical protein